MSSTLHEWTLIAVAAGSLCAGCSEKAPSTVDAADQAAPATTTSVANTEPTDLTYTDVVTYLESQGRVIGESKETYAEMIGATEGYRVLIDEHDFEIYEYEVETDEGQLAFTNAKTKGIMGVAVETYGNLVFIRSMKDPHPEFLTIVESIRSMPLSESGSQKP